MVADGIRGVTITEYKTTQSQIDVEKYMDYYQWRCYLLGFVANKVIYDIAQLTNKKGIWVVKDNQQVVFYSYPGIEDDVRIIIDEFISFCINNKLSDYIQLEG